MSMSRCLVLVSLLIYALLIILYNSFDILGGKPYGYNFVYGDVNVFRIVFLFFLFFSLTRYLLPVIYASYHQGEKYSRNTTRCIQGLLNNFRKLDFLGKTWMSAYFLVVIIALIVVFYPILFLVGIEDFLPLYSWAIYVTSIIGIIYNIFLEPLTLTLLASINYGKLQGFRSSLKTLFKNGRRAFMNIILFSLIGFIGYNIAVLAEFLVNTLVYVSTNNVLCLITYFRSINPELIHMISNDPGLIKATMIPTWGALSGIIALSIYYRAVIMWFIDKFGHS